ncbi:CGNR zinc finger domain-containing protein [Streptomyces fuscigenes]|uniref:CGNR zinc finger domain-containing protein n=1 Tax=Streptomyces fuscigenes TaxID=1528880 RepID=UPI001F32E48E|nr:CGNR zinc finger domain-containing protein [Streptomyces fuscigenes]MCF3960637.1 CGNR zinc finger domain-containing protein [Streptomyces fuscigenes]
MTDRPSAPEGLRLIEDLVNTRDVEDGTDALDSPEGRRPYGLAAAAVPEAKRLREALRAALLAHAGHGSAEELDALLANVTLRVRVDAAGTAAVTASGGDLRARVAQAVATASLDGTWQRLKACEADTCQWAFYDRSPAGRRRWCSMSVCGARNKMRTYRARRA